MSDDLLNEKTMLLNEVHHRVKNNFQIIISLIELQITRNPENENVFKSLINRIKSMSLTYEDLLLADNIGYIKFGEYVNQLVANIKESYNNIKFVIHNDDNLILNLKIATSAGIAINELLMNCCEHAFKEKEDDRIVEITLKELDDKVEIHVNDNGSGIPEEFIRNDSNTLGLNLINMLIKEQLEGSFYIKNDAGTKTFMKFNKV